MQILGAICAGDDKGLAAIDVDLVHFSKLIVSWNAMENVIRAVHVCNPLYPNDDYSRHVYRYINYE